MRTAPPEEKKRRRLARQEARRASKLLVLHTSEDQDTILESLCAAGKVGGKELIHSLGADWRKLAGVLAAFDKLCQKHRIYNPIQKDKSDGTYWLSPYYARPLQKELDAHYETSWED
tara:strand:- start:5187 stop:5537 length:351 start_codon:yes stop_codon:yes gene_type:complete